MRFVGYFHRFGIRLALRRNLNAINEAVRERPENLARLSSYLGYLKHSDNGKTYRALAGILSHRVSVASDIGRGGFSFSEAVLVSASVLSLLAVAFLWISRGTGTFSGSAVPSVPIASSVPAVFSVPPVPAFPASGCPVERVAETVNGASMEPLVANGTELTLLSGHYRCHAPEKGDLVAYRYAGRKNPLVKIVRATDADVLAWGQSGTLLVNGSVMANSADVPYSFSEKEIRLLSQYFPKGRIPEGSVLIFGDSVSASVDSRNFGAVGKGDLMGKFVWPR